MSTRYRRRAFLNKDRSKRAYVIAHVDGITSWESSQGKTFFEMGSTLELGDCSKTIYLDFSINNEKEKSNVLFKAKLLREMVNTFLDTVEAEAAKSNFKPVKSKKNGTAKKRSLKVKDAVELDRNIAILPADLARDLAGY